MHVDHWVDGKIKGDFEMLVNNFSVGVTGMLLAILAPPGYRPTGGSLTQTADGQHTCHRSEPPASTGINLH